MKNLLLYILALFCVSCIDRQTDASSLLPELQLAEELMYADTDSALHILQQMPVPDGRNSLQHATWALLLSEARYKSDISQSDSLIDLACSYFLSHDNHQRKALALYLKGCILNEQHREDEALPLLLQADEEVQLTDDYRLAHLNAAEIGILYSYRNLWDYAMKYLQKALDYAHKSGDNIYIASAYGYIARVYDANNEYDKAIIAYQNAIDKAPEGSYTRYRNLHEISRVFRDINNYKLALHHEKQAYEIGKNKFNLDQVNLALGRLYDYLGQKDSAYYFLNIAKESSNIRTARGAYRSLRELSQKENDYISADKYATIILDLQDSINTINRESTLIEMQEKYDQQKVISEKNIILLKEEKLENSVLIGSIIAIILITIIIHRYRSKIRQRERMIYSYTIQIHDNEKVIKDNQLKIKELESQIGNSQYTEEQYHELMSSIKELKKKDEELERVNADMRVMLDNYASTFSAMRKETKDFMRITEENKRLLEQNRLFTDKIINEVKVFKELKANPRTLQEKEIIKLKQEVNTYFNNYLDRLASQIPSITGGELELCALLKLGISNNDIATILNISNRTLSVKKHRLKEHIADSIASFSMNQDLDSWLKDF